MYVFGDNGIFKLAQDAKIRTEIAKIREKIDVVVLGWNADKILDPSLTVDDLKQRLVDADIMANKDKMTEKGKDSNGNDIYEIETKEGYIVEIIITPDGKASVGDITKEDGESGAKIDKIEVTNTESNSISIEVVVNNLGDGKLSYYYKKADDIDTYHELVGKQETTDLTATYTGLIQNQIYDIKVVVTKGSKSNELEISARTGELRTVEIRQKGPTTWSSGKASIEIEKVANTELQLKYQIVSTSTGTINDKNWREYVGKIGNLSHGQTVYAVLTDGTNYGTPISIDIKDTTGPEVIIDQVKKTNHTIEITVRTPVDPESGMPSRIQYEYYIKTTASGTEHGQPCATGPDNTMTFDSLKEDTSYDIKVVVRNAAGVPGEAKLEGTTAVRTTISPEVTSVVGSGEIPNMGCRTRGCTVTIQDKSGTGFNEEKCMYIITSNPYELDEIANNDSIWDGSWYPSGSGEMGSLSGCYDSMMGESYEVDGEGNMTVSIGGYRFNSYAPIDSSMGPAPLQTVYLYILTCNNRGGRNVTGIMNFAFGVCMNCSGSGCEMCKHSGLDGLYGMEGGEINPSVSLMDSVCL